MVYPNWPDRGCYPTPLDRLIGYLDNHFLRTWIHHAAPLLPSLCTPSSSWTDGGLRYPLLARLVANFAPRCRDSLRSDIFGGDGKNNSTATDNVFEEEPFLDENGEASDERKRMAHARRSYHYMIGNYEESTFFQKYLSNELISVPGSGEKISVRQHTMQQSLKNLNSFRSWFHLPLYKVEEIADRFITNGWTCQSHHCCMPEKLKIKTELLVI